MGDPLARYCTLYIVVHDRVVPVSLSNLDRVFLYSSRELARLSSGFKVQVNLQYCSHRQNTVKHLFRDLCSLQVSPIPAIPSTKPPRGSPSSTYLAPTYRPSPWLYFSRVLISPRNA